MKTQLSSCCLAQISHHFIDDKVKECICCTSCGKPCTVNASAVEDEIEMYQCKSFINNENKLLDCTCGKCATFLMKHEEFERNKKLVIEFAEWYKQNVDTEFFGTNKMSEWWLTHASTPPHASLLSDSTLWEVLVEIKQAEIPFGIFGKFSTGREKASQARFHYNQGISAAVAIITKRLKK